MAASAGRDGLGPVLVVARSRAGALWRSNLVVTLLVAATVAVALGALTAADRAESAFDRLRADSQSTDLRFFVDEAALPGTLDDLRQIDGIEAVGVASELFVRPVGSELFPDYQLLPVAVRSDLVDDVVDTLRIIDGRAPDPSAIDEIALSDAYAAEIGAKVGDRIEIESMSEEWVDIAFSGGDPGPADGPVVAVEVVGLARTPADFGRFGGRLIHLTPAFAARHDGDIRSYTWVAARLTDASEPAMRALAGRLEGFDVDEVDLSPFGDNDGTQDGLRTIATTLRLVATAGVLAGVAAVSLALARLARDVLTVRGVLRAIGWTRRQLAQLVVMLLGPWLLAGVAAGLLAGALIAPQLAVGLADAVDPEVHAFLPVPVLAALVAVGSAVVLVLLLAATAVRATGRTAQVTARERSLPQLAHPLGLAIGIRRAFFGAADRGGRASRGATIAAGASVGVAVAALLVGTSIQRLQDDPSLTGQGPADQRLVDLGETAEEYDQTIDLLEGDDRVDDLLGVHVAFDISAPGAPELTALVFDVRRGDVGAAILSGQMAVQPDEVAVGPATLDELGVSVGEDIELSSPAGSARFRVVGTTLFPEGDFEHDDGIAITVDGAERFLGGLDGTSLHQVAFTWAEGVDEVAADRDLEDAGLRLFTTSSGLQPPSVSNLAQVRDLPYLLAALVLLLGLVTLVHAVVVTTRSRTGEAAALRAIGVRPRAMVALVETQAMAVGAVATLAGVPLGLALGRQVWSPIADRASVVDLAVFPWSGAVMVALALLGGATVLAAPLAIGARRPPVARERRLD